MGIVDGYIGFREKLKDNKVIFETVMALVLSGAGIFVSCSANTLIENQNAIITDQKEIDSEAMRPSLDISLEYDDSDTIVKTASVNSIGGKIDEFTYYIMPIVRYEVKSGVEVAEGIIKEDTGEGDFYHVPFNIYYDNRDLLSSKLLHTREGVLCQVYCSDVYEQFREVANKLTHRKIITDKTDFAGYWVYERSYCSSPDDKGRVYFINSLNLQYVLQLRYKAKLQKDAVPEEYCETYIISPGYLFPDGIFGRSEPIVSKVENDRISEVMSHYIEEIAIVVSDNPDSDARRLFDDFLDLRDNDVMTF